MMKIIKSKKGFTLIELLIVVAIIGVLATLLMANFVGVRQRARDAQRKSDLRQIQAALEIYRSDNGSYPPTPLPNPLTYNGSTYMTKIPSDPMNTGQYIYHYLISNGTTCLTGYCLIACLENVSDSQKDPLDNSSFCSGGTTNWSYTLTNP
jgi:type II secretion system protein G